jgi:hypothetical protein
MEMTSSERGVAVAAMLAALLFAAPARAQTRSAADIETARELYNSGRALKEQGDLAGALEKLRAAHALGRTPITGIELARTYAALGQPVEAREVCLGIARMPVAPEETSRSAEARAEAAKLAEEVKPKIATLRIRIDGVPAARKPTLVIDGVTVPSEALGQPRQANPGPHTIVARVEDGPESKTSVELKEGELRDVQLTVTAPRLPAKPPGEQPTQPAPTQERHMSPLVIPGFATAIAGIGVGTVTGIVALSTKSDLTSKCPDNHCGPADHDTLDRGLAMGTASTIGFIVGGVGALVGVWGLTHPVLVTKTTAGARPFVGAGTVGIHGTF